MFAKNLWDLFEKHPVMGEYTTYYSVQSTAWNAITTTAIWYKSAFKARGIFKALVAVSEALMRRNNVGSAVKVAPSSY
jgi:hypothetical protein